MSSRTLKRAPRTLSVVSLALLFALFAGACGSPPSSPAASGGGGAGASGGGTGGTCVTAAAPRDLTGWKSAATTASIVPQLISSQQVCGRNRMVFGFTSVITNSSGQQEVVSTGGPDLAAKVAFYDLARDPFNPFMSADASFLWAIEGRAGVYVVNVTYPEAGEWGAEFTTSKAGGTPQTIRVRYEVQAEGAMPGLGATVPAVKTATLADVGGDVKQISTDPNPNPRFYQLSEDQAIAQHKPFVLVFATPAFCTSQVCGPTLEKVKALADQFPDVTFINVEPYRLQYSAGRLQLLLDANGQLQPNDAAHAFNLLSEPWIYVVDSKGVVTGSFEVLAGPDELKAAIDAARKG